MKFGDLDISRLTLGQIAQLGRVAGVSWGNFQGLHAWCHSMEGVTHVVGLAAGMVKPLPLDRIDACLDSGVNKLDQLAGVVAWCLGAGPDDFPTPPAA